MKLIILDRDGVINQESAAYIKSPSEWMPIHGSLEAIAALTKAGYTLTVASNQSGLGRGYFNMQTLESIHHKLLTAVEQVGGKIFKIYFCPHAPDDGCECRKPKTAMVKQMAVDLNLDLNLKPAIFVGDSECDLDLAAATGCKFYLTTGAGSHGSKTLLKLTPEKKQQITIVQDLAEVAHRLLNA
jgi:D-glycero-D-manno-heptose 1,7-bisphosphate phosphatase